MEPSAQDEKRTSDKRQKLLLCAMVPVWLFGALVIASKLSDSSDDGSTTKRAASATVSTPAPAQQRANETSKPAKKSPQSDSNAEGVILKGSTLYADRETKATYQFFAYLTIEGKRWTEASDLHVRILERGWPPRRSFVEVMGDPKGLKAARFWVDIVMPMSNPAAKWAMDKTKAVSKADFARVLNGSNEVTIGAVIIGNFIELVAGLYEGAISDTSARKCLVMRESIGGEYPCDLQSVIGQRLIYEGVFSVHEHFLFALVREPAFEKSNAESARMYEEIRHSSGDSRNPLFKGALVYVGKEDFTTEGGFVRRIPVFRVVNVHP